MNWPVPWPACTVIRPGPAGCLGRPRPSLLVGWLFVGNVCVLLLAIRGAPLLVTHVPDTIRYPDPNRHHGSTVHEALWARLDPFVGGARERAVLMRVLQHASPLGRGPRRQTVHRMSTARQQTDGRGLVEREEGGERGRSESSKTLVARNET